MKLISGHFAKTSLIKRVFRAVIMVTVAVFSAAASLPVEPNPERSYTATIVPTSDQPYFQSGEWRLKAVTKGGTHTIRLLSETVDLVEISYDESTLWAAIGLSNPDGTYESWVEGISSRQELKTVFSDSQQIVLIAPGTPESVDPTWCQAERTGRCHLTRLVELLQPGLMLDGDVDFTYGLSNVFVRTGVFPTHYQNGVLTWNIQLEDR